MSLWQLRAAVGGYAKANGAEDDGLLREEVDRLSDLLDAPIRP